jgi:hypothetical protein
MRLTIEDAAAVVDQFAIGAPDRERSGAGGKQVARRESRFDTRNRSSGSKAS